MGESIIIIRGRFLLYLVLYFSLLVKFELAGMYYYCMMGNFWGYMESYRKHSGFNLHDYRLRNRTGKPSPEASY